MNDQNIYVSNNNDNNVPSYGPQPYQANTNNQYQAPATPQQSSSNTFDYNKLYGNNTSRVDENKAAVVFEEPTTSVNNAFIPINDNQSINIASDELIPEFDASVLEVVPNQEINKTEVNQQVKNIGTMAVGKQAEKEKNRSNITFIVILFGVILAAVFFLFPMLVKF